MPSVDELFPEQPKSVDDLFPPEMEQDRYRRQTLGTSPIQDLIFGDTRVNPVARVLDHFRQGAAQAWGATDATRLSKESEDFLKTNKQFDAWNEGQGSLMKAANESLFRPAAVQMVKEMHDAEALYRGVGALFHGTQEAVSQIGTELGQEKLGREAAGAFEAFPTGLRAPTGIPHAAPPPMLAEIERARDLGVIGAGEEGYQGTKPTEVAPPISAMQEASKPVVEAVPEAPKAPEPGLPEPAPAPSPIVEDVTQKLIAAGRPEVEARASGELIASHYEARAERFGGQRGTAEQLYAAEGPDIRSGAGKAPIRSEPIRPGEGDATPAIVIPEKPPSSGGAAEAVKPAESASVPAVSRAEGLWEELAAQRIDRQSRTPVQTGYNPETSKSGAQLRGRATQVWEPGNMVDAGFVKDLLITEKQADGSFKLVSKPDPSGMSRVYEAKPHEGIAKTGQNVNFVDAASHLQAKPEPITTVPELKKALRGRAAADPQTWSLYEFLAREGGLKPTDDLKSIFGGKNPFVPGFGPLLRKGGLTMDEALTRAKENSYILDPNDLQHVPGAANSGELTRSVNDLQDMIAEESRGRKNYRTDHVQPEKKINPEEERTSILDALHRDVEAATGERPKIDPAIEDRVVEIVQKEGVSDVHDAYERAIMEDHDRFEASLNERRTTYGEIADHDFDSGATSRLGEELAGERGQTWASDQEASEANVRASRDHGEADRAAEFELDQIKRGKINIRKDAKPIITLFKDANASTFVHETGHAWLEELMKDADHPKSPGSLRDDAATVQEWLGVHSAEDIKTSHHEKFARGFERYMMEGRAPNQALANVFEKFKNWLTKIYQTVTRLKSPINDEIRGVFDRLLTMHPSDVRIEPEGPPKTFADVHEADALGTPPETAHPVAETIQAERDRVATEHVPEEHDARLEGVTSEAGRREAGGPQPLRDVNEARPDAAEARDNQASGTIGEGGSNTPAESIRPSVGGGKTEAPVSPQAPFEAATPLMDKAGNIRLENLNTTEDVKQVIRDSAERNNDFIEARRGVVTDGDAIRLAEAMGMTVEDVSARKLGEAWNKEQIFALEKLFIDASTAVRDAMASGNEMAYAESVARFRMIQETVQEHTSGVRAEAGRALQAFAALKKMAGRDTAVQLGDFLQANTGKTLFQLQREMKLGQLLETPAEIAKFVTDVNKPTWKDMLIEGWITALLSGPKTHMANIIGNTISGLARPLETAMASGVGRVLGLVMKSEDRVHLGEAGAELFGMVQGSREGLVAAYKAFKTEEPQLTPVNQTERSHQKAIPSATVNLFGREMEVGGKQARIPLRLLGAEDEFFKAVAFRGDINRQAIAIATKEKLPAEQYHTRVAELSANPTDEMIANAKKVAEYQTFQQPLGKVGRAIQNFSNSHPLAKVIVPFVRTPLNLIKYAGERTPLGVLSQEVRDNLAGKNGAVARDTQIARITLGTMLGVAAYEMASQGLITGDGPNDPRKKAVMQADGWQPYSVKLNGMYYSYRRLDPFSMILGIVADAHQIQQTMNAADAEKHNIPALVFGAISKTILDRASLKGSSDLIQAMTQFDRFGNNYIKNMAGTVVPALSAQTAQAVDPIIREARTVLDNLKARIPGLSQTLHPSRDIWGEPRVREGGLGPDIASPIAESRLKNDPVNQALLKGNYFPAKLDRKIRGVELTDQQYDDYSRIAGRMAKTRLNAVVNIIGNPNVPESARHEMIQNVINSSRESARSLIIMQSVNSDNDIMKKAREAKMLSLGATAH